MVQALTFFEGCAPPPSPPEKILDRDPENQSSQRTREDREPEQTGNQSRQRTRANREPGQTENQRRQRTREDRAQSADSTTNTEQIGTNYFF